VQQNSYSCVYSFSHSFTHSFNHSSMALQPLLRFPNRFTETVGLQGRVISPLQGRYLNTGQHKQNKRIHTPNIHASNGIRTHDSSVRASESSSCLRPRCHCDRPYVYFLFNIHNDIKQVNAVYFFNLCSIFLPPA
jgi:hypothetical protein